MRIARVTAPAEEDIVAILAWSEEHFGTRLQERYGQLIDTAIGDIAAEPERLGSRARPDLAHGLRTYHLSFSRQRARGQGGIIRQPRHLLVYRLVGDTHLEIIRVLHDAIDVGRHAPDDMPPRTTTERPAAGVTTRGRV
jgi:toxin ParE1/3/4